MSRPFIDVRTPSGVRALFTRRCDASGALSFGGASSDALVATSRDRLASELGVPAERIVVNRQVHGNAIRAIQEAPTGDRADGLVTDIPGWALMVLGADCVPILAWKTDASAVGAAHAGWRGLLSGVGGALVAKLGGGVGLAAAIGPAIGPCCYPVNAALRARFRDRFGSDVVQDRAIDLPGSARIALEHAGIDRDAISSVPRCTRCTSDEFFSFRRDGEVAGRQAGVVLLSTSSR